MNKPTGADQRQDLVRRASIGPEPSDENVRVKHDARRHLGIICNTDLCGKVEVCLVRLTSGVSRSGAHDTQRRCRLHAEVSKASDARLALGARPTTATAGATSVPQMTTCAREHAGGSRCSAHSVWEQPGC